MTRGRSNKLRRQEQNIPTKAKGPGWGPNDPVRITSETKVTICPKPPAPTHTCTHEIG